MAEMIKIAAQPRERAGKGAARAVRRAGRVPAVIYGEKQTPALCDLDPRDVVREIEKPGFYTRLIELDVGGRTERVLPRDVQFHPVSDKPEHVDFLRVGESTRLRVAIPVRFMNQDKSPGLKRGGVLNIVRRAVEVYCPANAIPSQIEVNLDGLDIGDSVHISHVKLPEGVRPTITGRDFTIAAVAAPTTMAAEETTTAAATAEGAAAAAAAPGAAPAAGAAAPAAGAAAPAAGGKAGAAPAAGGKAGAAPAAPAEKKAPGKK
jgi:large subunit ribosomal protein L25